MSDIFQDKHDGWYLGRMPDHILRTVAEEYECSEVDLKSARRAVVPAKKEATHRLRRIGLSWSHIGRLMNCCRTTAMYRGRK